jgi:peptidoglycan DL-endopeptidase CwlO
MNDHHTDIAGSDSGLASSHARRHAAGRPKSRRVLRTALLGAMGTVLAAAGPAAMAAPTKPVSGPGDDASPTRAQIAALYRQADVLTQTYDAAQEQADRLSAAVRRSQDDLRQSRADYAAEEAELGGIAAAQYREGYLDERLELLLADHPETFLATAAVVDRLSEEQLRKITSVIDTQRELVQLQHTAADQLSALAEVRAQATAARRDVVAQLHRAQSLVSTLSWRQRRQVADDGLGADPADDGDFAAEIPTGLLPDIAATGRARTAIAAAYAVLGKPYVYGAEGPDAFDCSGLIQRVWREAGVELPRTSSEQATAGRPIPPNQIQPGDLVIYYRSRSHIGLYIGDGKIIHAPHPGSQVRISPLNSMPVNTVVRV